MTDFEQPQHSKDPNWNSRGSALSAGFPTLVSPPIVEVACGVIFDQMLGMDGISLGVYCDNSRADYPHQVLQPAVHDSPAININLANLPLRAVLVSNDKSRVVQLQYDRFITTWNQVAGNAYPGFSKDAGARSLVAEFDTEFKKLGQFCTERFAVAPLPQKVEVVKVNILRQGTHWTDLADLDRTLTVMGVFRRVQSTADRDVALRFVERGPAGEQLSVAVHSMPRNPGEGLHAVRLETRCTANVSEDLVATFEEANNSVNTAFFNLISPDQLGRFGTKGGTHGS